MQIIEQHGSLPSGETFSTVKKFIQKEHFYVEDCDNKIIASISREFYSDILRLLILKIKIPTYYITWSENKEEEEIIRLPK